MGDQPEESQPPGTFRWNTFLDTPPDEDRFDNAKFVVLQAPYEATTSFLTGTRDGPSAIIEASAQLEDYDLELDTDISTAGIHTVPALAPVLRTPHAIVEQVDRVVDWIAAEGKIPALLGGEHTVTTGAVKALSRRHTDLSVLYLDAHGDLRDSYMGTGWGHASVARRLLDVCPVVHAGVRSVSAEERSYIDEEALPVHYWPPNTGFDDYARAVVDALAANVYLSIDLDVLDPSIMAAVGTPEPDGMDWRQITYLLRMLGRERRIVGFDVVELCPRAGPPSCAYTAAKLVYKVMGYSLAFDQT